MLNPSAAADAAVYEGTWTHDGPPPGGMNAAAKGRPPPNASPAAFDASSEPSMDSEADSEETMILEDCSLSEMPEPLLKSILQRPGLLKLSLKGNQLRTLPPPLSSLANLYYLNLSHNAFTEVPPAVCSLPGLEILDLSFNGLQFLPDEITRLENLMVLSLVANNVEVLPPQIADLRKLVILEIDDNPIRVPNVLPTAEEGDEEAWLSSLREYIGGHQLELQRALLAQKQALLSLPENAEVSSSSRAAFIPAHSSQSSLHEGDTLRAAKRMGFVMQRNAPGSSYVASLHARGMSHDAHMLDGSSNDGSLGNDEFERATAGAGHHSHSMSSYTGLDPSPLETVAPRSPLPRSPRESPWSSPRPSVSENLEPQSATGSRLGTLAEEGERAESDDDAELVVTPTTEVNGDGPKDARAASTSGLSSDGLEANSSLFKESYLTEADTESPVGAALERITYAMSQVANAVTPLAPLLPPDVVAQLSDALSRAEEGSHATALKICTAAMERLTAPLVFRSFVSRVERRGMRSLVSALLCAFPELEAAWRAVQEARSPPPNLESSSSISGAAGVDAQLHIQLEYATKQTQTVLSLLNEAISRSAQDAANASEPATALASRIRVLSESSLSCAATARSVNDLLDRSSSARTRALSLTERGRFWDEVNVFLKSIISMLGAVKEALDVIPLLATSRIGPEVSSLARCAKEIPPLLEQSSYKVLLDGEQQPGDASIGKSAVMLAPPTPLTAAIGAAAQALISPSTQPHNPFFDDASYAGHSARR